MNKCIFCNIINGKISAKKIFENHTILSFHDINPAADQHALIIPKKHISSLNHITEKDHTLLAEITILIPKISQILKIHNGFKTIINTGTRGGQKIFHLHYHVLGNINKSI